MTMLQSWALLGAAAGMPGKHTRKLSPAIAPTAEIYKQLLLDHAVHPWFPRSIDRVHGGFLTNFDRRWRERGRPDKMLEAQARQTLAACELALTFPNLPVLAEAVSTGFRFLRDVMWDHAHGGWHSLVDRAGSPINPETKHLHGIAYALQACFAVYAATGDASALDLGRKAFEWIDAHAHDATDGGYFAPLRRDGTPIRDGLILGVPYDHIGTPIGQKDMNVTSDLLEAFGYSYAYWPDERLRRRLEELIGIFLTHFAAPNSPPWFYFNPNWTAASSFVRPSTIVQTVCRLIELKGFAPDPTQAEQAAFRIADYAFRHGWNDELGGLVIARFADRPMTKSERENLPWWVQIEALKALEYCLTIDPDFALAQQMKPRVWSTLLHDFVDPRYGGFYSLSRARLGPLDRLLGTARAKETLEKGNVWKDTNHEARALLRLARLFPEDISIPQRGKILAQKA